MHSFCRNSVQNRMITAKQLASTLGPLRQGDIKAITQLGDSSNRVYQVEVEAGARYVVKIPKQVRENGSPFWRQMAAVFGLTSSSQLMALPTVAAQLQQQSIIPVPQMIQVEATAVPPATPYALMSYLAGVPHEPDEFPASADMHYQLGQYVGYLHSQSYAGYGNILMAQLQPKVNFLPTLAATMHRTVTTFWHDEPALHGQIEQVVAQSDLEAVYSTAALIMIDISANQFVYQEERISGVVDLDAYVIGPREWELTILELCITDPIAFRQGYECYHPLPVFAPFRPLYRLWSYLNEPQPDYNAAHCAEFMQRTVYFE